jgi:predicted nucleic acid-binding Zn ribbon protein
VRKVQPIGKVLRAVIEDLGIAKKLSEQRAVVEWPDVVGGRVAEHARAVRVDRGRLYVEVDSSIWAQELSLMKPNILKEVNTRIGRKAITNVLFTLGGAKAHGVPRRRTGGSRADVQG